MTDIRAHPWYQMIEPQEKQGTLIGKMEIMVEEGILEKVCKEYQVSGDQLRIELKRNKFNSSTTIYYMLLKRAERTANYKKKLSLELTTKKRLPSLQANNTIQARGSAQETSLDPVVISNP